MKTPSPWDGSSGAQHWTEAFRATGRIDARAPVKGRDGEPDIMDDGLVCLLFDD